MRVACYLYLYYLLHVRQAVDRNIFCFVLRFELTVLKPKSSFENVVFYVS